jgi:hypothetical protein
LTPDLIEAAVRTADYRDRAAEAAVLQFLLDRRFAILARYLPAVNPIVDPALGANGILTFANAAVEADVALAPAGYRTVWSSFDNETGATTLLGERTSPTTWVTAAWPLRGAFLKIDISAIGTRIAPWTVPVHAYFRSEGLHWRLVGLDREPGSNAGAAPQWTARSHDSKTSTGSQAGTGARP